MKEQNMKERSMKIRCLEFLTAVVIFAFIINMCILISFINNKKRSEYESTYDNLYFVDDSLISGLILVKTLEYFNDSELKIIVKTKLSKEVTYIWDGERKIDNYDFNAEAADNNYIYKNALFRVEINKTGNRINYVMFKQEY